MMTRNKSRMGLGAVAIILVAAGFWAGKSLSTATITPLVRTGTVGRVGADGQEFTIRLAGDHRVTGYGLPSDVTWRDAYGNWQDGTRPACMRPMSRGQHIRFGLLNAAPVGDAPGSPLIVWIECPSRPVPGYPIVSPSSPSNS